MYTDLHFDRFSKAYIFSNTKTGEERYLQYKTNLTIYWIRLRAHIYFIANFNIQNLFSLPLPFPQDFLFVYVYIYIYSILSLHFAPSPSLSNPTYTCMLKAGYPIPDYIYIVFPPFCWSCRIHFINTKAFTRSYMVSVGDWLAPRNRKMFHRSRNLG